MSTSTQQTPHGTVGRSGPREAWTLAVVLLGFFVLPMSMSGAGVAVPRIATELHTAGTAAQWVVTAYFLTASAFMLIAGSLGDTIGRRLIYRIGAIAYTLGNLAAALAPTIETLLAARVLTGLGAAGVMAGGGAILGATFTGPARARAFAAMGTISGLGLALGPTLSGWLVDTLGWRLGFAIFTLPGLLLIAGTWLLTESRATQRPRIDLAGAATFTTALIAIMLAITQGATLDWLSPAVLALTGTAVVLFPLFVIVERRAPNPLLDLSLLTRHGFAGWLLAAVTMSIGFGGILSFLPSYLQAPAGLTASETGLVMILPTVPMMILPSIGSRLINKGTPPRLLITTALAAIAAGNLWLTVLNPAVTFAGLIGPLVLLGTGVGLAAGIIDAQAMNHVRETQVGMAAGMLNTVRSTANALILGIFGPSLIAILTAKTGDATLSGQAATGNVPAGPNADLLAMQLTDAWHIVLIALAVICAAAAITVGFLTRKPSITNDTTEPSRKVQRI